MIRTEIKLVMDQSCKISFEIIPQPLLGVNIPYSIEGFHMLLILLHSKIKSRFIHCFVFKSVNSYNKVFYTVAN